MDTASSSRVDGRLDRTFSASASGGSFFCFAKLGMGGFWDDQYCLILASILILDLLKMIFYLLYGKSTIWGIYREYVLFFGASLSKSMLLTVNIPAHCEIQRLGWLMWGDPPRLTVSIPAIGRIQKPRPFLVCESWFLNWTNGPNSSILFHWSIFDISGLWVSWAARQGPWC